MRKLLLSFCTTALIINTPTIAQDDNDELDIEVEVTNPSREINDGIIEIKVSGGKAPYTYKWTDQNTSLKSNKAVNLVEGISYDVIITDANQVSVSRSYEVKTKSIAEDFNGLFKPAVDFIGNVLFWDPFASIGLYDPVIYADAKQIPAPHWTATTEQTFVLAQKIIKDGKHVKKGDPIAVILIDNKEEITVKANATGILNYRLAEGEMIFNPNNEEHLIEQGAHFFADITYDEPVPLRHPNGDIQKKSIPFIVIWLIIGAIFFTFRMGFINFRGFKHAIQLVSGKYNEPDAPGQVTHFQALATAVSATVGLGNIAGVAVAVSLGGAGATFWMILAGFLGMSTKFVECTLGVKYRHINKEGKIFGGPMNYLRYGLEKRNKKGLGRFLAGFFAVLCIGASFGGGNMFQSNQAFVIMADQFSALKGHGFVFGIAIAVLVGIVIIGGIQSIAKVTGKIVPIMAAIYILAALIIIGMNFENIGPAFTAIYEGAFSPSALKGGFIGVLIVGFQRASFSNEAGVGSAAIAHSTTKTNHPASEGFVALLEPFIDTVVVCTLTALVIIFTGMHEVSGVSGVNLTSGAFGTVISWFPIVLAIAVFLFAFSTMISWSYYGMRAWTYLFGKSKRSELLYKINFLVFVVVGASVSLGSVLQFSDMMILAMSFPNIIGLYILSGEVRSDLKVYLKKLRKGELYKISNSKT
ncbi:amino acid carrier protein [Crocinitomix algicola]|uniref:amino acid carrier protein n=1 Tax=Crocinitomix algicola TaxID=1740263 RepID=UPI0008727BA5|nr:amino acid carrier protein [Crocinitomix algicola]